MLALYRSDRQADALRVYQKARRILQDELGVDPCPRLRDLHHAILSGSSALALR
jgi:DNA-binding SARP family transcriptional activator